jgi:poly(3-hydroxybutyrate) depolymerase
MSGGPCGGVSLRRPVPQSWVMTPTRLLLLAVLLAVLVPAHPARAQAGPDRRAVERALFRQFLAAKDPREAARLIDPIVATGVSFDTALARLRQGRSYASDVPRGRQDLTHRIAGIEHPYTVIIPEGYDPARAYPVRVQLHGGVGGPMRPGRGGDAADRIPGTKPEIYVLPNSWAQSMWWQGSQADNLAAILDQVKRSYNVDENRVYMTGISDGGTGAWFFAFREPTAFSSFLPLNGQMMVLSNPSTGVDGDMYPGNAVNRPFFAVNGGRDPLYPAAGVRPYVEYLQGLGAEIVFHVQEQAEHNTQWWPEERAAFERFLDDHPRNPFRDRLSWETERTDRYNRVDWLVIDRIGASTGGTEFGENNALPGGMFGRRREIFPHSETSGRVDLVRRANVVTATTQGVRAFTLLLSPSQFDLRQPVTVIVNGDVAFRGPVTPSVRTLLVWAARDNDRAALYGVALPIEVR